jgi:hypothetical protein
VEISDRKDRNSSAVRSRMSTSSRATTWRMKSTRAKPPLLGPSQQPPRRLPAPFRTGRPNPHRQPEGLAGSEEGNPRRPKPAPDGLTASSMPEASHHHPVDAGPRVHAAAAGPRRCAPRLVPHPGRQTRPPPPSTMGGPPPSPGAAALAPNLRRHDRVVRGDAPMRPKGSPRGRNRRARRPPRRRRRPKGFDRRRPPAAAGETSEEGLGAAARVSL